MRKWKESQEMSPKWLLRIKSKNQWISKLDYFHRLGSFTLQIKLENQGDRKFQT